MLLNIGYIPEFVQWKVNQGFRKINKWPLGAGGVNMHFAYWPPQLNVKVLPQNIKEKITNKYEKEFYPWCRENWQKFTGVTEAGIEYDTWNEAVYGIKRYQGLIKFMNSEDWSSRLPETREYLKLVDSRRGLDYTKTFPLLEDL